MDHGDDEQIAALFEREQGRLDIFVDNVWQMPDPAVLAGGFWTRPLSIRYWLWCALPRIGASGGKHGRPAQRLDRDHLLFRRE